MRVGRYVRPASLADALAALDAHGPDAIVIAGGTDLVPAMRKARYVETEAAAASGRPAPSSARVASAHVLVDVGGLDELQGVGRRDGFLRIGGATRIADVAASPLLREEAPVVADAARSIGSPLVRNRATIGGNLATASPSGDMAPALLALDAVVRLASASGGEREEPFNDFCVDYRCTLLQETELITDVLIPVPSARAVGRWEKVGLRSADAISVTSVATMLELDGTTCLKARIALGAVAPVAVRAFTAEQALEGQDVDAAHARACAALVHQDIEPIDDVRASAEYRRWVAEAVVARSIVRIAAIEEAD
jgi:CO/xanthine dehydrogenase FAD-binding subunit